MQRRGVHRRRGALGPGWEGAATDHPKVVEAAVIGHFHPKWSERPLLIVERGPDVQDLTADDMWPGSMAGLLNGGRRRRWNLSTSCRIRRQARCRRLR